MYRAIIIDDELNGIEMLKTLTERHLSSVRIVASTTDPEKGIRLIEDYRPDIVFLDITMPILNGFEVLEKLNYKDFKLLFTTAHEEYAIKAINNRANGYLLKPIDIDDLKLCIANITEAGGKSEQSNVKRFRTIELSVKDGVLFIKPEDIIRLEASGSYTEFYLENNIKHVASKNLKDYESLLDPNVFYRCHLSHIVNLKKIVKLTSRDGLFVQLNNGSAVPIAKRNKQDFLSKLKDH